MFEEEKKRPIQKKKRCALRIKKGKDGSITREITGDCSKNELMALQGNYSEED